MTEFTSHAEATEIEKHQEDQHSNDKEVNNSHESPDEKSINTRSRSPSALSLQHRQSLVLEPPANERTADLTTDGGFLAWLQVFCSFILFFNSWGIVNSFGTFQGYYTTALPSTSASDISWIGSIQAFLLLCIGVITGPLYDAGYFYHLVWAGSFLSVLGLMMTSLSTQFWQLMLSQGICMGLGSGCLFLPSVATIPLYFKRKRAFCMGIAASGSSLGGIIYPIVFAQLQPQIGFAWATRVMGFMVLGTQAVALATMRGKTEPGPMRKLWDLHAFRELPFVLFMIGMVSAFLGTYIPIFYLSKYMSQVVGGEGQISFYVLSILNAGSVFGRILPSYLADRVGPLNMLVPCALCASILAWCWIPDKSEGGVIAFAALYGFFTGCIVAMPPIVAARLTTRMDMIGTRMGTLFTVASLGLLVGTPVGGAILGDEGNYLGIQIWSASTLLLACGLFTATRIAGEGWKLKIFA